MSALPRHEPRNPGAALPGATTPRADIVTASDLVRHFGLWQERAARAPVYVMFRGRPRLVLTSIEVMEALLAPHLPDPAAEGVDSGALLDLIRDMVLIVDADLRITAASRPARAYFGAAVAPGMAADGLVPSAVRNSLLRALRHVQASGVAQKLDLPSPRAPDRLLLVTIEPHRQGFALLVQDVSPDRCDEWRQG
ncbi:PAS domain-containing protein [Sphingomonas sp. PB4P5]|uniref:PAS domain-containing protein n=1 Tax=Parasphingomonas puruogangriensis TaxID=3096155 RepID=UPI002FC77C96